MIYTLCNPCAVYVMYSDDSLVNSDTVNKVDRFVEEVGTLVYLNHSEDNLFECDCCGATSYGIARHFDTN